MFHVSVHQCICSILVVLILDSPGLLRGKDRAGAQEQPSGGFSACDRLFHTEQVHGSHPVPAAWRCMKERATTKTTATFYVFAAYKKCPATPALDRCLVTIISIKALT